MLGAGGLLASAKEDVLRTRARTRVRHPSWFRDYARLEADAAEVGFFSMVTVPGLLQTEEYARLTFTLRYPLLPDETIEQRVADRLARQEILTRWAAPDITAIIDEAVLRRQIGSEEIHDGQLKRLLVLGKLRSTLIQVLPLDCDENAGIDGPFVLLTPKGKPQVACVEAQGVNRLITDLEEVRVLAARYGRIRGQALTPRESLTFIEKMGDR